MKTNMGLKRQKLENNCKVESKNKIMVINFQLESQYV